MMCSTLMCYTRDVFYWRCVLFLISNSFQQMSLCYAVMSTCVVMCYVHMCCYVNMCYDVLYFNNSSYPASTHIRSSSCHQTVVFHCSTHCFAVSLNCIRSSKEQECARSGHSNICLVFSDETPQLHVISPS